MLSRVAIQASRLNASGSLANAFRSPLLPAKRSFGGGYSWGRVSSSKPWAQPLRDTIPKQPHAKAQVAFSLDKIPQNIVGFFAILGCAVFMSPMGVVTGYNMYQGVTGKKNITHEDGTVQKQFKRQLTNVCNEGNNNAAGVAAGRKFNPKAMHPYMNGLTTGDENAFNRQNSRKANFVV